MRHQPHLYVPGPWTDAVLRVPDTTTSHLERVLRYPEGGALTYTDGEGSVGSGTWTASGVRRGPERRVEPIRPQLTIAVAPPRSKDRQRFIVEKLQELAVSHLTWLGCERSQAGPPRDERIDAWARSGIEQSRGAWLLSWDRLGVDALDAEVTVVADQEGSEPIRVLRSFDAVTVAIGPEGGFTEGERARFRRSCALGSTVLRTETAAVAVAAALRV